MTTKYSRVGGDSRAMRRDDVGGKLHFEQRVRSTAAGCIGELRRLVGSGKVFDMSMGLVIAGCFNSLVRALADHIVAPIVAFVLPVQKTFKDLFVVLQCGPASRLPADCVYDSCEAAFAAGAVTLNWGAFLQAFINAMVLVVAVYITSKVYTSTFSEEERRLGSGPPLRVCPECDSAVSFKARRCAFCTTCFLTDLAANKESESDDEIDKVKRV